jgi:hypothetical protein
MLPFDSDEVDHPNRPRLAELHIIGEQQIGTGKPKDLMQRKQLIVVEPEAGSERKLRKVTIGGADCTRIVCQELGLWGAPRPTCDQVLCCRRSRPAAWTARVGLHQP